LEVWMRTWEDNWPKKPVFWKTEESFSKLNWSEWGWDL
jgi:hypothetical protein